MHEVALAFFWHQHQPYYPDDVAGENPMPWVRLHGTKDYWGMAMLLGEVPEMHATINLVPSLLTQILAYTERRPPGRASAHFAAAGRRSERSRHELPAGQFLHGPSGPHDPPLSRATSTCIKSAACRSIRPSRPANDSTRKTSSTCNAGRTWRGFTRWPSSRTPIWPSSARRAGTGRSRRSTGCLDKQMELLPQVIPLHRELQERGQVELTTTPFYHPILPLLWDKRLARRAMPDVALPKHLEGYRRRRRGADPPRGRTTTRNSSARNRAACGPRKARSARR